jgi:predicted RNA-binding protein with PUA-like domain
MPKASSSGPRTEVNYWLFKSEPVSKGGRSSYSIEDLKKDKVSPWDGVRNYEARNHMKNMKVGDLGFFYHSNSKPSGIVGIVKVVKEAYPDYTALDPKGNYYDPKSKEDSPRWFMVDVEYVRHLNDVIPLDDLKEQKELKDMQLISRSRLSVSSVGRKHWDHVLTMEPEKRLTMMKKNERCFNLSDC